MFVSKICDGFLGICHSLEALVPELLLLLINRAVKFDITLNQVDKDVIGMENRITLCSVRRRANAYALV